MSTTCSVDCTNKESCRKEISATESEVLWSRCGTVRAQFNICQLTCIFVTSLWLRASHLPRASLQRYNLTTSFTALRISCTTHLVRVLGSEYKTTLCTSPTFAATRCVIHSLTQALHHFRRQKIHNIILRELWLDIFSFADETKVPTQIPPIKLSCCKAIT